MLKLVREPEYKQSDPLLMHFVKTMALSTKAQFGSDEKQQNKNENFTKLPVEGDASEAGLIRFLTPVLSSVYGGDIIA